MEPVKPAHLYDGTWSGTTAAEESVIVGSNDLYELAGLEHREWTILGIDMGLYNHAGGTWNVRVYALDCQAHNVHSHEDLKKLEAERGSLPVKEISLHDVSADDILRCMKTVQIQFLSKHFQKLDVVDRGDHPAQD